MFERLRLKLAKRDDAKRVARLFSSIDPHVRESDVERWIQDREVYVLKHRKRIKGAFSYSLWGFLGLFGWMYVRRLAVDKRERGQGLGSLLLSKVKGVAKKLGMAAFFLFSLEKATQFYQKNRLSGIWRLFWWKKKP
jgi:GNAT superfamily N-acetyltransferase